MTAYIRTGCCCLDKDDTKRRATGYKTRRTKVHPEFETSNNKLSSLFNLTQTIVKHAIYYIDPSCNSR